MKKWKSLGWVFAGMWLLTVTGHAVQSSAVDDFGFRRVIKLSTPAGMKIPPKARHPRSRTQKSKRSRASKTSNRNKSSLQVRLNI